MSNRENKSEKCSYFPKVPISDYPAHVESFETYYYLGEYRTLKETALIRFKKLVPNCRPNVPEFRPKFDSFYRKIKRWAEKEGWNEWVKRKEIEERQTREKKVAAKTIHLSEALKTYRDFIRKSLEIFADKARLPVLLKQAITRGDTHVEAELWDRMRRGEGVEIKNFREAKDMIKLDIHLNKILDQQPQFESTDRDVLSEEEAEKIDRIMEIVRKKAMESCKRWK